MVTSDKDACTFPWKKRATGMIIRVIFLSVFPVWTHTDLEVEESPTLASQAGDDAVG